MCEKHISIYDIGGKLMITIKNEKRYKTAVRLFGKEVADIVCEGEVQLGFTTEMCSFAYEGEPYHESYETIPIGTFLCRNYYASGVKLN